MRELREDEVTFTVECEQEHIPIKGNALASGDDEEDARCEQWIIDQLNDGNQWAWCSVKVTARWRSLEADEYLGGCSYLSEEDFRQPGGYYDDMKSEALAQLNAQIAELGLVLATLDE